MSYAQWSSFAYYNTGDIVGYEAVNYQALLANINVLPTTLAPNWQLLTPPTPSAVDSLNTLTGNVVLSSGDATFTPNSGTGVLDMVIAFPAPPFAPSYGSFFSSTTQALNNGAETVITYDAASIRTSDIGPSSGGTPFSGILVSNAGVYKFLFSIQVDRTGGGNGQFQAYLKVNSADVPDTNTQIVVNQNTQTLNTCEFILQLSAISVIQVVCWSNSAGQRALAVPISPTTPVAIPSIISNITRIA
jgi:hypothetical protein